MLKRLLVVAGVIIGLVVVFLLFITIAEYRPQDQENAIVIKDGQSVSENVSSLSLVTWNIGYAGLDKDTDFVLDGGTMGCPRSQEAVEEAMSGISDTLAMLNSDVYILQEVDRSSSRTGKIDEADRISSLFSDHDAYFAPNYKALIVPFPLSDPIGKVDSGILTLSEYNTDTAVRWQLPGYYDWPVRTIHLKRCALETRIPSTTPGIDWVILNVHLTAYGDGSMRVEQLAFLKEMMNKYYNEGHYVIIGGDWNSLFPGVTKEQFGSYTTVEENLGWLQAIPDSWTPEGWQWAFDMDVPTCRTLDDSFVPGENLVCLIDGFLVSPNVSIDRVIGHNIGFEHSDHNPVSMEVSIK
ncbi:MAG: hypothetical protein B6229_04390 [Spirochaetaceae bacterium 4572_7]|nr:MAG: hypothetical protein B6229_04390 [Spirochaetaceae bacterium 4572_7]